MLAHCRQCRKKKDATEGTRGIKSKPRSRFRDGNDLPTSCKIAFNGVVGKSQPSPADGWWWVLLRSFPRYDTKVSETTPSKCHQVQWHMTLCSHYSILLYPPLYTSVCQQYPAISQYVPIKKHPKSPWLALDGWKNIFSTLTWNNNRITAWDGLHPSPAMEKQRGERVGLIWPQPLSSATARTCPCDFPLTYRSGTQNPWCYTRHMRRSGRLWPTHDQLHQWDLLRIESASPCSGPGVVRKLTCLRPVKWTPCTTCVSGPSCPWTRGP